jgi:hypothetical protein
LKERKMEDLDLSEIDPLKWAEVRRRADAVKRFLAIPTPSAADREHYAGLLGLGAQQFSNLVKAWVAHSRATALSPGEGKAHRASRSKAGGVPPIARSAAREIISKMGPETPLSTLMDAIRRRCADLGVPPPSRGTVWLLVVEARGQPDGREEPTSIVVGRAFMRLPVRVGTKVDFPEVLIAAEAPTGRVIEAAMARNFNDPKIGGIAAAISHRKGNTLPVYVDEEVEAALRLQIGNVAPTEAVTRTRAARMLAEVLGRNLGRIELAYRPLKVRPATVMQSGRDRPLSLPDAQLALQIACERHNRELGDHEALAA